ncbi:MAG: hypothetical protein KGI45_00110 [Patescibacteria group bacterium]|nr:hypothetical protein [Patescibacteria group bacterium]
MNAENPDMVLVPKRLLDELEDALAEFVCIWDSTPKLYEQAEPLAALKTAHNELISVLHLDSERESAPANGHKIACLHSVL